MITKSRIRKLCESVGMEYIGKGRMLDEYQYHNAHIFELYLTPGLLLTIAEKLNVKSLPFPTSDLKQSSKIKTFIHLENKYNELSSNFNR